MATNYDLSVFVNYCSVLLDGREWSGRAGVPGSVGLQCSLCHHCLLVNCFWGKQVVTWLELSNLIGQPVRWLDLSNLIGQLLTLFNKQMVAWSHANNLLGQLLDWDKFQSTKLTFTSSPGNRDVMLLLSFPTACGSWKWYSWDQVLPQWCKGTYTLKEPECIRTGG